MTRSHLRTSWQFAMSLVMVFAFTMQFGQGLALAAGTAPGTVISNTATASYTDGNGVTYTTNSNTVTTNVQNAPSLTITDPATQSVTAGEIVVDSYVLTNTGNAAGTFSFPTTATVTTATGAFDGYVIPGTTCTVAAPCSYANAQTQLATLPATAVGGTLTVGIEYTALTTDVAGQQPATTIAAAITQAATTTPGGTTIPLATSTTVNGTIADTIVGQARIDLQKYFTSPTTATAPIAFKIVANNGGGSGAYDLQSVKNLLGGTAPAGVLITDAIPTFPVTTGGVTTNVPLTITGTTSATPGAGVGTTTLYYSTSATGAAGSWTTTYAAGDYYIGVLVSGGTGGLELPADAIGSTGVGVAENSGIVTGGSVTTAQVTLNFSVVQPTGAGSANPGAISNLANAVAGGVPGASGISPIIGPGITTGTPDSPTGAGSLTPGINNTTPAIGTTAPGGASNKVVSQAFSAAAVLNGPVLVPGATGSYTGTAAATNATDFTAVGFNCGQTGTAVATTGTACIIPTAGVTVPGEFQNTGNASDVFTLTASAPTGFVATIFAATCPATFPAGGNVSTFCTKGAQVGTPSSGATPATGTFGTTAAPIASNGTVFYEVTYTPVTAGTSSVPDSTPIDSVVTVTGTGGGAADSNTTHNELFPGGPLVLSKAVAVTSTNCPGSGQTANAPCPGATITYTITYTNTGNAAGETAAGADVGTEPAYAYAAATTGTVTITEDGTGATASTTGNNWYSGVVAGNTVIYSGGLNGAPTVTNISGTTAFTFAYSPTAGTALASSKFTAAAPIAPGASGTIVFSVTLK